MWQNTKELLYYNYKTIKTIKIPILISLNYIPIEIIIPLDHMPTKVLLIPLDTIEVSPLDTIKIDNLLL